MSDEIPTSTGVALDRGDALRRLYEEEQVPMVRLASLLVSSHEAAEDVVQDAFGAVERHWDSIDRPGAYLRTTVVNGCRAVLRRRATEQRSLAAFPPRPEPTTPEHLVDLLDALDRLDDRHRSAIVLRFFVDLPFDEVARTLDCRPSTARSLVRRGVAALRRSLQEESP